MDFMLKELKTSKDKRAPRGKFRPVVILSGVEHQFAEDVEEYHLARRICIAYSKGHQVFVYNENGERFYTDDEDGFSLTP